MTSASSPALAQSNPDQTVQRLYQMCKPPADDFNQALCAGYITGVGDYMTIIGVLLKESNLGMCSNLSPSYGVMIQAFIKVG
jgi:hypothetical protein